MRILSRKKQQPLKKTYEQYQSEVLINITNDPDLLTQIDMIQLTKRDLCIVRSIQPMVKDSLEVIVDNFYRNLEKEPEVMAIIHKHSSVERLKKTLLRHMFEMFSGKIDDEFIKQRNIIAHVHVRIGLKPKWYMCAFQELLHSIIDMITPLIDDKEEYREVILAVTKLLNLEQQIVLDAFEVENERIRLAAEDEKQKIKLHVSENAEELAAISEETSSGTFEIEGKLNEINSLAELSSNVVIGTVEKSKQGSLLLENIEKIMKDSQGTMEKFSTEMTQLTNTSKKIDQIVTMVTSIAEQTNLLALNAAIEAARAGEHGKGFAVVAGEVRKLAESTKKSVSEVSLLVSGIRTYTGTMNTFITSISEDVQKGTNQASETTMFFNHILESLSHVKEKNVQIADEMSGITEIFHGITLAFEQVATSSDELNQLTIDL